MKTINAIAKLGGEKYRYVAITTLVSLLAFARNLLFMKTLNLAELGQIAMMQTLVMLVGFVQLGIINGAYLQYAVRDVEVNRRIVQALSTILLLLIPISVAIALALKLSGLVEHILWPETLSIGIAAGVASLASTWMNNALIAEGRLDQSNTANFAAVSLSIFVAYLSKDHGLKAALFSILLQPLTLMIAALALNPNLRPRSLALRRETLVSLFRLGLNPFLGGLAVLALLQVERWTIATAIGPAELGRFYIVIMYIAFFSLVPGALLNVYLPRAKMAYANQDLVKVRQIIKKHNKDMTWYLVISLFLTISVLPMIVKEALPQFSQETTLVFYALPSLVLLNLRNGSSLALYCTEQLTPLLTVGIATLAIYVASLAIIYAAGRLSLEFILLARILATAPGTLWLQFQSTNSLRMPRTDLHLRKVSDQ